MWRSGRLCTARALPPALTNAPAVSVEISEGDLASPRLVLDQGTELPRLTAAIEEHVLRDGSSSLERCACRSAHRPYVKDRRESGVRYAAEAVLEDLVANV